MPPEEIVDNSADVEAGEQRAAALEENLGLAAEQAQRGDIVSILVRIESKLDQLLARR